MRILVCPDKFKGSLSALEVCKAIQVGIQDVLPDAQITLAPMADGGEGSLEALAQVLDFTWQAVEVLDPLFRPIQSRYALAGREAHIEMAKASGLGLLSTEEQSPLFTSTLGTGQLIQHAIANGAEKICLWVGGSATNDGGMGLAQALGFRFLDVEGQPLPPTGENLTKIRSIKAPSPLPSIPIELITDVNNVLCGPKGAAQVFAEQKGASVKEITLLDQGLENLARVLELETSIAIEGIKGIGAAGGVGACIAAYMDVQIRSGIETLLKLYQINELLLGTDLVLTGEGKLDHQTLQGKVVQGVVKKAKAAQVPTWIVCGRSTLQPKEIEALGVQKIVLLQSETRSVEYCMTHAVELLKQATVEALQEGT